MNPYRIPVMRVRGPRLEDALPRLQAIEDRSLYSNFGPEERELRERYSKFLGVDGSRVATAANATLALSGAVAVLKNQRWLVPSFTFAATPAAVLSAGGDLRFEDVSNSLWLQCVADEGAAVMPVAPFGDSIDFRHWQDYPAVVFDAAASIGAPAPNWIEMSENSVVVFSLHATKVLGSGEGAILVFGDSGLAEDFRSWTNFGFSHERVSVRRGQNAKMSEVQAAYAHAALDSWDLEKREWRTARELATAAEEVMLVDGLTWAGSGVNPYWIVQFGSEEECLAVERTLSKNSIESRRWWQFGCHEMSAFSGIPRADLPITESVSRRMLGLPMFRGISEAQVTDIVDAVLEGIRFA